MDSNTFQLLARFRRNRPLRRVSAATAATLFLFASAAPVTVVAGTPYLGGNAVLEQLTRVSVKSSSADSVSFAAVDNARVGVLDWSKLSVGDGQSMAFSGAGTTFLNLVDGAAGKSQIDGMISGNGNVWVINPAGIAFGAGASIDVGGLFAAAAGTVGNADALRAGTAELPAFSSFGGSVEATKGTFSASQVALLGKTVKTGGEADFTGTFKVDVGGGDHLVVDDVGGGMVSVDIGDFAATAEDVVDISGLLAGDVVVDVVANGRANLTGDIVAGRLQVYSSADATVNADKIETTMAGLTVASLGEGDVSVSVRESSLAGDVSLTAVGGAVTTDGALQATRGDVRITAHDGMTVGDVTAGAGSVELSSAGGDIVVDGTVSSGAEAGQVLVKAATDATRKGSVIINGELSARRDEAGVVAIAGYGALEAEYGQEILENAPPDGPVTAGRRLGAVPGGLSLVQVNRQADVIGKAYITLRGENGVYSAGTIDARTAVLEVHGHEGAEDEIIGKRGVIDLYEEATGKVLAGEALFTGDGDAYVDSPENEIDRYGVNLGEHRLFIDTGVHEGDVEIGGVVASELYHLQAGGTIRVTGDITAPEKVILMTKDGDIIIFEDCVVTATGENSEIHLTAGGFHKVEVRGSLDADKKIDLTAGSDVEIAPGASLVTRSPAGEVTMHADRNVAVDEDVSAGQVSLSAKNDVIVRDGVSVAATGGGVSVVAGRNVNAGASSFSSSGDGIIVEAKNGSVELHDVSASGGELSVMAGQDVQLRGTVEAEGGYVAVTAEGDVEVSGSVSADTVRGGTGDDRQTAVSIESKGGAVAVTGDAVVESSAEGGAVVLQSHAAAADGGGVTVEGTLRASGRDGLVSVNTVEGGTLTFSGAIDSAGQVRLESGRDGMVFDGEVASTEDLLLQTTGDLTVRGTLVSESSVFVETDKGSVTVDGRIDGGRTTMVATDRGSVRINGTVAATGRDGVVLVQSKGGGSVSFGANGRAVADSSVIVNVAEGDLTQSGNALQARDGRIEPQPVRAAISADQALMTVGGSIGSDGGYFGVDGKMYVFAGGDAYLAAADGTSLRGGAHYEDVLAQFAGEVDVGTASSSWANNTVKAGGDLFVYTSSSIEPNGLFYAGRNLTVSAASFGDMSYLRAGGQLTINNVGTPASPQIAYFESVDGVEPRINNQPNDTVIFVDGRLAGGNLNILNKFGADEAFMVETPELKSTQGIFGNPPFLHSDLDVANPMEVCAIDYLIQEIPRLTLASDFPSEVDKNVEAAGLGQKDVYWFGQKGKDGIRAGEEPEENTVEKDDAAEPNADDTLAYAR